MNKNEALTILSLAAISIIAMYLLDDPVAVVSAIGGGLVGYLKKS